MAIQNYNSPIFIQWNTDSTGRKISIAINNEQHQIANMQITLNQIPDFFYKVKIDNMYEIKAGIPNENEFRVDYNTGIVSFNISNEAKVITIKQYWGRGIILYPASRIYDNITGQPIDATKTLQDFINKVKEYKFENFDPQKVYVENSIVYYHGSTFLCIKQTLHNEIPTNTEYWTPFATGTYWKGIYDNTKHYDLRDIVYFEDEKATYICIKQTTVGINPQNTEYWQKIFSVKEVSQYAQTQGDYAKEQGNYAKQEGDYAKSEGDYAKQQGDYITNTFNTNETNRQKTFENNENSRINTFDTNENDRKAQFNVLKANSIEATNNANQATLNTNQATSNYTTIVEQTKKIYKPMVNTYADIITTYPHPEIGWTTSTKDTHIEYRWDGIEWVDIGVTDGFQGYNVYVGATPPSNTNLLWVRTAQSSNRMARVLPSKTEPVDKNVIWWKVD